MSGQRKKHFKEKSKLHPRNKHRGRYDFDVLKEKNPDLVSFVAVNQFGDESIDFHNPKAVKQLNKALLKQHYGVVDWDIPKGYLCPPIPGRVDYIHYVADLISNTDAEGAGNKTLLGNKVRCIDIGVGANCIYPILGVTEYGWLFVGSDIDKLAIESANDIVESNTKLKNNIQLRLQNNSDKFFQGIIAENEFFDCTICNPPFHSSPEEAEQGSRRKVQNLKKKSVKSPTLNFGGKQKELWCEGGELSFVGGMIKESAEFAKSCMWFTSLVSKEANLKELYKSLKKAGASDVRTIAMGQGNKVSRILAWTFLSPQQGQKWLKVKR